MAERKTKVVDASPFEEDTTRSEPLPSSKKVSQSNKSTPNQKTKTTTPFEIFNYCIDRAENLIKIHQAAHGKKTKPEKYLADAHRAAIVLSISALDAFIRTYVIEKIRQLLANKSQPLPQALNEKIKKFCDADSLLEAARNDDLLDRVEKAFLNDFQKKSFQGTKIINEILQLIGIKDVFHSVAMKAKMNEDQIKQDLDEYTERRHLIAHRGDYDLQQQPPKEKVITKKYVKDCIKVVKVVAKHIKELEKAK